MKFILGKKLFMTQLWRDDRVVPVTCIKVEPCVITQIKTRERDGYRGVQVGTGRRAVKNIAKPQRGHFGAWGNFQYQREFNLDREPAGVEAQLQVGQHIAIETFVPGDLVQVTSVSKGRGFQGGVKRHGFQGQGRSHGDKDQQRMPGSVGATGPAHIFKGTRMPGQYGSQQVTVKNLEVVEVDVANGYLYLRGAVPGWRNGLVAISGSGELITKTDQAPVELEETKTEPEVNEELVVDNQEKSKVEVA